MCKDLYQDNYPLIDRTTVSTYVWDPECANNRQLPAADAPRPSISLVATVRNESSTIESWLDSIAAQTRPPDEIVIVDGGSTDNTYAILKRYAARSRVPMRVSQDSGANIARGRNLAIQAAAGPIIACTDAGCVLAPDWLAAITGPFAMDADIEVSAGYYRGAVESDLQRAMAAYLIAPADWVDPQTFLPSARSLALRKDAWARADGFPEWLTLTAEDTLFDVQLKAATREWAFVPEAQVAWRLKSTLGELYRQVRTYARGDGEAGLFPDTYRRQINVCTNLASKAALSLAGAILALASRSAAWLILSLAAFMLLAYQIHRMTLRLHDISGLRRKGRALILSALVAVTIPAAMSIGFVQGVRRRSRQPRSGAPIQRSIPSTGQ